jgi:hypothetical protein
MILTYQNSFEVECFSGTDGSRRMRSPRSSTPVIGELGGEFI